MEEKEKEGESYNERGSWTKIDQRETPWTERWRIEIEIEMEIDGKR